MAAKVSYSNSSSLPSYGSKQVKPVGTTAQTIAPAYSARTLSAAAGAQAAPDTLARVLAAQQNTFTASLPKTAPATTAPPASQAGPVVPTAATTAAGATLDMNQLAADPIYAQIVAAQNRNVGVAGGARTAGYEQALTGFGDPGLATSTLTGLGLAPSEAANYASAAQGNPSSTLAQLLQAHQQNNAGINSTENKSNLFYSSDRANKLGQEGQSYLNSQSSAQDALHQLLASYDQQYQAQAQGAEDAKSQAASDAYGRLLQAILAGQASGPVAGSDGAAAPPLTALSGSAPAAGPSLGSMLAQLGNVGGPAAAPSRTSRFFN